MREILFRGKRKDFDNEWLEGFYTLYNDNRGMKPAIITGTEKHCFIPLEIIPETVGQYTGLTDKNGKKIFEGDIVEVTYLTRCYDNETEIREVTYNEEECCYYPMRWNETCEVCDYFTEIQSIEVIGNIHDNPELLKGDKSDA